MFTVMFIMVFMAVIALVLKPSVVFTMMLKRVSFSSVGHPMVIIMFSVMVPVALIRSVPIMRPFPVSVLAVMLRPEMLFFNPAMIPVFAAVRPGCTCH